MSTHRFCLALPVFLAALLLSALTASTVIAAPRVIGGTKVDDAGFSTRWSAIVSLGFADVRNPADAHFCGGVRIAERLVLTARHCVESGVWNTSAADIRVTSGSPSLRVRPASSDVVAIYRTPDTPGTWFETGGDLAILELRTPLSAGGIATLARPEHAAWWGAGAGRETGVRVAGWGIAKDANFALEQTFGATVPDLQEAELPVLSTATCAALVPRDKSVVKHICAGQRELPTTLEHEGRSACYGDSGGPLLASDPAGLEPDRVIGIVSRGTADECAGGPGIYVNVADRAAWIDSVIAKVNGSTGLRAAPPSTNATTVSARAFSVWPGPAGPGGSYLVEIRQPGWHSWIEYGRFTTEKATFPTPPSRSGAWSVRVRKITDGIEGPASDTALVGSVRDVLAPRTIARFSAVRRGHVHQLAWTPSVDRGDHVVAYYIEQRKVGGRWQYEAVWECGKCWRYPRTRWGALRSTHTLLPGRRQFRIAAIDRAGNWSAWTVSRPE